MKFCCYLISYLRLHLLRAFFFNVGARICNFSVVFATLAFCGTIVLFISCNGRNTNSSGIQNAGAGDIVEVSENGASNKSSFNKKADIDLVKMNYNMISARLFNMLVEGDKYIGKTVRFRGEYFVTNDSGLGEPLHSCLIYDETACCQTGLQFEIPSGKEYPKEHSKIEIFGPLQYKEINGMDYFYVACNDVMVLP